MSQNTTFAAGRSRSLARRSAYVQGEMTIRRMA